MIETERLLLRPPLLDDLDRWAEMMADIEVARYIGGVQQKPVVWRSLMSVAGAWALTGVSMFAVVEKATGLFVGRVGPWTPYGWPGTEIGWSLHADAQGRGLAYEAAVASMNYAFDVLGWTEVIHSINPENRPSQRLAQRLGSSNFGIGKLPAPYENDRVEIWGQSREQWRSRVSEGALP